MSNFISYLERLTPKQQVIIKSLIIDMDNRFNKVFLFFSSFNYKFSPGNKLIDISPNYFSFYTLNRKSDNNIKSHLLKLNDLILQVLSDSQLVIIVTSGLQLKVFGYSNLLCARATRVIVNYASVNKYWLKFFPQKEFKYLCGLYSIESRYHIFYKCRCFNNYWNQNRDSLAHFTLFLEFNSNAFSFGKSITQSSFEITYSVFLLSLFTLLFLFFFSFFSFSSYSMSSHIYSYKVAIMVSLCALCNKLLIF